MQLRSLDQEALLEEKWATRSILAGKSLRTKDPSERESIGSQSTHTTETEQAGNHNKIFI